MKTIAIVLILMLVLLSLAFGGEEEIKLKGMQYYYTAVNSEYRADEIYQLTAKKKHIDTLRDAANAIHAYGKQWGLNDYFIKKCLEAYNETQDIVRVENKGE